MPDHAQVNTTDAVFDLAPCLYSVSVSLIVRFCRCSVYEHIQTAIVEANACAHKTECLRVSRSSQQNPAIVHSRSNGVDVQTVFVRTYYSRRLSAEFIHILYIHIRAIYTIHGREKRLRTNWKHKNNQIRLIDWLMVFSVVCECICESGHGRVRPSVSAVANVCRSCIWLTGAATVIEQVCSHVIDHISIDASTHIVCAVPLLLLTF